MKRTSLPHIFVWSAPALAPAHTSPGRTPKLSRPGARALEDPAYPPWRRPSTKGEVIVHENGEKGNSAPQASVGLNRSVFISFRPRVLIPRAATAGYDNPARTWKVGCEPY